MKKDLEPKNHGFALPLALLAVVLLFIVGSSFLTISVNSRIISTRNAEQIKARCAADSGLVLALWDMNNQLKAKKWNFGSLSQETFQGLTDFDAVFSYEITNNVDGSYLITSIGNCGNTTKTVHATVGLKGLFEHAIIVQNKISLMPNSLTKGFNSSDPFDTEFLLALGTTSISADQILLSPGTIVNGDVFVGVGGNPGTVIGDSGTITGMKYSLTEEPKFPAITPPSQILSVDTALSAKGTTTILDPSDSGRYSEIDLSQQGGNPGILEIQGGEVVLHITGDIDMGNGCEIIIRPGSSLILYIDGDISMDNSVGIDNQAGSVNDFKLYSTGSDTQVFSIKAKSSVFGTVYAPDADINLYPNTEMVGAIVGKSVMFKSGSVFYYDEAVRDVTEDDEGVRFDIVSWDESEPQFSASIQQF